MKKFFQALALLTWSAVWLLGSALLLGLVIRFFQVLIVGDNLLRGFLLLLAGIFFACLCTWIGRVKRADRAATPQARSTVSTRNLPEWIGNVHTDADRRRR